MIPSEFNQDAAAQRRKLRLLREAKSPKTSGPANRQTWLDVQPKRSRLGMDPNDWRVFRVEGVGGDADQLAGPFKNKKLATDAAKKIAAKTGEPIGNPHK